MDSQTKKIDDLLPYARVACRLFLKRCREEGLNIFITETYRSQERQNRLYEQGRTKPGPIVTWTKTSRHTKRTAWDIACKGSDPYNIRILNRAGEIGKALGLIWGGDWMPPDRPHFEVKKNWKAPKEDEEMTQEQFNRMMDSYLEERGRLPVSGWAREEFEKAENEGIIDGTMPQAFATREQVAAMIIRSKE